MVRQQAAHTTLRIVNNNAETDELAQHFKDDVTRLANIVKKQQNIIVEYATREHRAENVFKAVAMDSTTSRWLESERGSSCALKHNYDGKESSLFNSLDNLERVHALIKEQDKEGLLNWGFDILAACGDDEDDITKAAELAVRIFDLLDIYPLVESLDAEKVRSTVRTCVGIAASASSSSPSAASVVNRLRTTAICILHVTASGRNLPNITGVKALGCLVAVLACALEDKGLSEDYLVCSGASEAVQFNNINVVAQASVHRFFAEVLPSNNFCEGLTKHLKREFQKALLSCAAAADPKLMLTVVNNLDMLTLVSLEKVLGPENPNTYFTNNDMLTEILLQGVFCASAQGGTVCAPLKQAEHWMRRDTNRWEEQGALEKDKGLEQNAYAEMLASCKEVDAASTTALLALNLVDFSAAPLWVALTQIMPQLQEPMGHLYINREHWAALLFESGAVSKDLKAGLMRRSDAFNKAFANILHEPASIMHRTLTDSDFMHPASRVFMHHQEVALRSTGATANFLAELSGMKRLRETHVKTALAQTVGLLEEDGEHAVLLPTSPHVRSNGKNTAQVTPLNVVSHNAAKAEDLCASPGEGSNIDNIASTSCDAIKEEEGKGSTLVLGLPKNLLEKVQSEPSLEPANKETLRAKIDHVMTRTLQHPITYLLLTYLTIFALFGDDIKRAAFDRSADSFFGWITLITFLCFVIEMTCKVTVEPLYMNSLFFWLDLVATISLVPDITVVLDALINSVMGVLGNDDSSLSLTRATHVSRASARAARILRILRLIRLIRILKLYEFLRFREMRLGNKGQQRNTTSDNLNAARYLIQRRIPVTKNVQSEKYGKGAKNNSNLGKDYGRTWQSQSKVGAKLADFTTRRVVIVVLTILFILPLINNEMMNYSIDSSLGMLHAASVALHLGQIGRAMFNKTLKNFIMGTPRLIMLQVDSIQEQPLVGDRVLENEFRSSELYKALQFCGQHNGNTTSTPITSEIGSYMYCSIDMDLPNAVAAYELTSYASVDNRAWEQDSAARSIVQTLFIIVVFGVATMIFTYDAHKLVIAPIEKMVRIVEALADDPLTTFEDDNDESLMNKSDALKYRRNKKAKNDTDDGGYETDLLENCIKKIGGLLQVGFGEAGAKIMVNNMNGSGLVDLFTPGRKVQAVFGFCNILNFTSTTEVLREDVMLYVNEISNIVHTQVTKHSGNANRNMGDKFLLVWKRGPGVADDWETLAEKALISFLKILVDLHRNSALEQYNDKRYAIGAHLHTSIPNFKVNLGFGLHVGWAIEGAIGSNWKVDACYVSPHVNLASQLEENTCAYGTSLLMSGEFHELLSPNAKRCCRIADKVVLKGLQTPTAIYTYDCNMDDIKVKLESAGLKTEEILNTETEDRRISLIGSAPMINHKHEFAILEECPFQTDLELRALQWEIPLHFMPVCRKGVTLYLAGKWNEAKVLFDVAISIHPAECNGPSANLLKYMEKYNFNAPADWKGFRESL